MLARVVIDKNKTKIISTFRKIRMNVAGKQERVTAPEKILLETCCGVLPLTWVYHGKSMAKIEKGAKMVHLNRSIRIEN